MSAVLPPLVWHESPNQSSRLHGITPYLVVVHRPVGGYAGSIMHLCDPASQASAHVITDSNREATQLVAWDQKAWSCKSFNSVSYNVEVDDDAWNGEDPAARVTAARIVAFICKRTGIPPTWTLDPLNTPGVVRHYDLGLAGGGHTDPTTSTANWREFLAAVRAQWTTGGFRKYWGTGTLAPIDV